MASDTPVESIIFWKMCAVDPIDGNSSVAAAALMGRKRSKPSNAREQKPQGIGFPLSRTEELNTNGISIQDFGQYSGEHQVPLAKSPGFSSEPWTDAADA
jgi:hypothetical protein